MVKLQKSTIREIKSLRRSKSGRDKARQDCCCGCWR